MADYQPWATPNKWPIDFQNYQFLFRATLQLGEALFGDEWTGEESIAELYPALPSQPPNKHTNNSILAYQRLKAAKPELQLSAMENYSLPIDWTPELWREAIILYKKHNEQQTRKCQRFAQAKSEIFGLIRDGKLKSYLRPKQGGQFSKALNPSDWNTERWATRFIAGYMNPKDPFGVGFAGDDYQYIYVDRDDLQRCLQNKKSKIDLSPVPDLARNTHIEAKSVIPLGKQVAAKRGPKPKVNLVSFENRVHEILEFEGTPDPVVDPNFRQADVEARMMIWHNETYGESRNRELTAAAIKSYSLKHLKTEADNSSKGL